MQRQILNRWTGAVIWSGEAETMKDAIHAALAAKANLYGAHLGGANLDGANLGGANLGGANLDGANLDGANLDGANLYGANLGGANLGGANLYGANLYGANLRGADLRGANLRGAHLDGANLREANLGGAHSLRLPTGETWIEYLTETVPALLMAGGKSIETFAKAFDCHSWDNCPMAHAFDGHDLSAVPILLRPRAEQFIQLFDANQIPWPLPTRAQMEAKQKETAETKPA